MRWVCRWLLTTDRLTLGFVVSAAHLRVERGDRRRINLKVTEFLQKERVRLDEEAQAARDSAPDPYLATVAAWPHVCRGEFLTWLGSGQDIPHDEFPAILRRIAGHNEVHDRGGFTPAFASDLLARWQASHAHE